MFLENIIWIKTKIRLLYTYKISNKNYKLVILTILVG